LAVIGGLAVIGDSVCKKRWSVSFAFFTSSFSGIWLCICFAIVDILNKPIIRDKAVKPFLWLGMNPLFIYISMTVINTIVAHNIKFNYNDDPDYPLVTYINEAWFNSWIGNEYVSSTIVGFIFLAIQLVIAFLLYRKRIFIKL
jgi:predicted acyltransferase